MNRQQAMQAGLKTYDTGSPCAKGHTSPRYTSCGVCVECSRQSKLNSKRLHTAILAARTPESALFAYKLHPDDHAAALAFCQALDLQRGRQPASEPVATVSRAPVVAYDAAQAAEIARRRAEAFGEPQAAPYVPEEFARHGS